MMPIRLFCSDLDGTLLGNPESTTRFKDIWESIPRSHRPILCYASGRLVQDVIDLLATGILPWPEFIIGGVGTQIYDGKGKRAFKEFDQQFNKGWDLEKVERILSRVPGVTQQPPEFLHPYKSSWYLLQATPQVIESIEKELRDEGLHVSLVYSSARDLDVLPAESNKGLALRWLCNRLELDLTSVIVAGDTGNDSSMFHLKGVRGILVENAQPELIESVMHLPTFNATRVMAEGVLEGLRHFGVITDTARKRPFSSVEEFDPTLRNLFSEAAIGSLTTDERSLIAKGYREAIAAIRRNITPLGFSACSLEHNDVTGTDANYRSVWGRDGAITIVGTVELESADIRTAQVATLRTLFDHLAPNGQVPSNVKIDDGQPDYSGVGGICSVDGGLWAIIAFHAYIRKTDDLDLLNEYASKLERVMTWLSALDSNNDGLLEIPEAGDWTDLFGRSYHVLYDEVLWYRALVAYSRLLELQKRFGEASEYLRRSQSLRFKILEVFWPSTKPSVAQSPFSFARSQLSVGDTSYLLAEVTPFGFSWRCDVIGNLQGFISNVLDVERARTAFKFMWGVGVNEPYPVMNLYPPVQSGDHDWRSYYTVNLLNLPGHYHNGGIWPFIGGMWVRFVHRLGFYDVACRELFKLAELNRLGKNQEWEFNEWIHSKTGRPMGKCFQAWSASSYIHACQELQIRCEELAPE